MGGECAVCGSVWGERGGVMCEEREWAFRAGHMGGEGSHGGWRCGGGGRGTDEEEREGSVLTWGSLMIFFPFFEFLNLKNKYFQDLFSTPFVKKKSILD